MRRTARAGRRLRLVDLVGQVASSRSTILITGETGTGKELIAKAIHANSPRADRLFVPVNSGTLPAGLLKPTLFGHVKGGCWADLSGVSMGLPQQRHKKPPSILGWKN